MRSRFFAAYGLWHVGEGFQTILMMWYMTFHAHLSASQIGLYQSLQLFPFLAFTALGGSLVDRIGARQGFAAATGLFALTLGFYGLAEPLIGFDPMVFGGYCLLSGLLSAISNPAIDTFIPEATPRPAIENALFAATTHNIAKLCGNAATLLLPVLSAVGGFAVNGLLMAGSALMLLRLPARPQQPAPRLRHPGRVALLVWAVTALVLTSLLVLPGFGGLLVARFFLGGNSVGKALVYGRYLQEAPKEDRALLIGVDQTAFWGLATLGTAVLGWLVDRYGFATVVLSDAAMILLCVVLLALRGPLWRLGHSATELDKSPPL